MLENTLFETHFDIIPFDIYVVDVQTLRVIYMNRQLRERYGEQVGQPCHKVLYEQDRPCIFCKIKDLISAKNKPNGRTFIFEHFNEADDRWYQLQEKAITWPDGRVAKYSIAVDITELKETQNRLAEAHAELHLKNKELKELSNTDQLTGLANRFRMMEALAQHTGEKSADTPFSAIMMDLDRFKDVNDTYGHPAGDTVLRALGDILSANASETDVPGRWGGEEFLTLCLGKDLEQARELAETVRRELESLDIPGVGRVTASMGVAQRKDGEGAGDLLRRADEALYRAKDAGRNCVDVAS